ncbi:MAG: hypothetical protein ABSG04_09015 [Verrucomicrobiota bacterium]
MKTSLNLPAVGFINKAVIGFAFECLIFGAIFWGVGGNCDAAIVFPKAPDGGEQIVRTHLDAKLLKVPRIEDVTIADAHREYFVGLTNLAAGHLLSAAKIGPWRYLLLQGTNAVGAAELNADEKTGKALGFRSLQRAFEPEAPLEALRMAEKLPQVQKEDYEVRYLDIAPVLFVAVWLHRESDDIIIPLPNTFGRFKAYQPYSESEIIKVLKTEAEQKLKAPAGSGD